MKRGKYTLHIYWSDGVTIELRYFYTENAAREYVERNGIVDYLIDKDLDYGEL